MNLETLQGYDDNQLADERWKCKTNLFYLATEYLDYDLIPSVHQRVCDFFIRKDPSKPIEEQDVIHDRLLLDPREHYKTTIDVCDIVQWIICFPNIRIAVFSGTEDLVKQIVELVVRPFQTNEKFKFLFPEHAISETDKVNALVWTTPARSDFRFKEPTVWATTINSGSTGGHYEVIKFDDIVTPQNSETRDQLEKVKNRVASIIPLVVVGGYRDFIGTRYDHSDVYGHIVSRLEEPIFVEDIPFGQIIRTTNWKVLRRAACSIPFNQSSSCLFPVHKNGRPNFNYSELRKRLREMDNRQFGCQYLNDPQWGDKSSFPIDLLVKQTIPHESIPLLRKDPLSQQIFKGARAFITWDLAFSTKKQRDRTVGAVGCFDHLGRLYIVDLECGRFSADEYVQRFLTLLRKWYPFLGRVAIEKAGGSQLIEPALKYAASQSRTGLPIDWIPTNPTKTKDERVFGLLPLLRAGKLFFSKDLPFLTDLYDEFSKYPRGRHDDIPDAVSMLLHYQSYVDLPQMSVIYDEQPIDNPLWVSPLGYGIVG